jgi:hypothetical protein
MNGFLASAFCIAQGSFVKYFTNSMDLRRTRQNPIQHGLKTSLPPPGSPGFTADDVGIESSIGRGPDAFSMIWHWQGSRTTFSQVSSFERSGRTQTGRWLAKEWGRRGSAFRVCLLGFGSLVWSGCAPLVKHAASVFPGETNVPQRFEYIRPQMGLPFRLVLYATNEAHARSAAAAAYARVEQLNALLSDYDSDSELSQLSFSSGHGTNVPISADLALLLQKSQRLARETDGAFDVTVGPIVNLWRKARREQRLPRPDLLAAARRRVGWNLVHLGSNPNTARLDVDGMRLDLGAIAKGYAVDEALKVLERHGIRSALVAGGGDLAVSAAPPGRAAGRSNWHPLT